jgi:hypothetical protein
MPRKLPTMPITAAIRLRRVTTNSAPTTLASANAQNSAAMLLPDEPVRSACS